MSLAGSRISNPAPGGAGAGSFAPVGAEYVVMVADATLTNERVLTAGAGIVIVDGGAGGPVTISAGVGVSGWTDDGAVVRLTTITDDVGIGTVAPAGKLHIVEAGGSVLVIDDSVNSFTFTSGATAIATAGLVLSGGGILEVDIPTTILTLSATAFVVADDIGPNVVLTVDTVAYTMTFTEFVNGTSLIFGNTGGGSAGIFTPGGKVFIGDGVAVDAILFVQDSGGASVFTADSSTDTVTIAGKLTVTGAIDPTSVLLSDPALGTALFYESNDGQTAPVSGAATGRIRYNNVTGTWQLSTQAGAYASISTAAASGWTDDGTIVRLTTSTDTVAIGAAVMAGVEKLRVVPASGANTGIRIESDNAGAGTVRGLQIVGTSTGAAGFRTELELSSTYGSVSGTGIQWQPIISSAFALGSFKAFNCAPNVTGGSATTDVICYDISLTNNGTIRTGIGYRWAPLNFGVGWTTSYGVAIDNNFSPATTEIGGHFYGGTAALEVGDGALGAYTVAGRWFSDSDMVLGGSAMIGTERLRVVGDTRGEGTVALSLGTAALPAYTFIGDTNTGIFSGLADAINFSTGGTSRVQLTTTIVTSSVPFFLPLGTAAAPAYSFNGDTDTGMFSSAANTVNLTTAGVLRITLNTVNLVSTLASTWPLGTAALPAYSFTGDTDTGIYSSGANTLNVTLAGAEAARFTAGQFLFVSRGTAALPAYTFTLDPDTGMFSSAANILDFSTAGTARVTITTGTVTSTLVLLGPVGSAAAPTYSFSVDADTGMFASAANTLDFSTGGTARAQFTSAGVFLLVGGGTAAAPAIALTGDTNTGIAWTAADTLVLSTGGTARLTIDSAGKVTIPGTLDPTSVLLSGGTALFYESNDGSTAPVSGAGTGRIRFLSGTGWQVSSNGGAYATLASGGITGAGANTQVVFWTGASTVSGDAQFTFDSVNDRLTVAIVTLGANATPAVGDLWFETPFLKYRTGGGTEEVLNAGSTQTITGQKTFSADAIFSNAVRAFECQTQIEFDNFGVPTAGGKFARNGAVLQWHDGGGVRTILTDGVAETIASVWTFNAVGSSLIIGDELQFTNAAANATAGGRLRRNGVNLTWFDSGVGAGQLLCTVSAHTITGVYTFSTAPVFGDGVRVTFNPDGTNAGLNVGQQAGDPSTLVNGDVWYNSSINQFRVRRNGISESISRSVLAWGAVTTAAGGSLVRYGVGTEALPATDSFTVRIEMPYAGTLRNLFVRRSTAPGIGATSTYAVRINGADSAITVSIAGAAATTGNDTTNTAAVVAGDLVEIRYTVGGGIPIAGDTIVSLELD